MRVLFLKDASNHVAVMWEVYDGHPFGSLVSSINSSGVIDLIASR